MKTALFTSLALFASLVSMTAAAAEPDADGPPRIKPPAAPISAVLVYPDGAMITRRAKVALPAGRSVVVFDQLTPDLDEASLLAKVTGAAGVRVAGVSAEWQGNLEPIRENEAKLTAQLEKLGVDLQTQNDHLQALALRRQVLEQYRTLAKDAIAQAAGDKGTTTAKWKESLAFITKEQDAIAADERTIRIRLQEINEQRSARNSELAKLRSTEQRRTRRVEVELEATSATEAEVGLDYAVAGAGWFPAYDVRHEEGKMRFIYYGTVVQGTGEDWKDIALTLSTARPSEGAQIPTLTPLQLSGQYRSKQPVQIVSYGKKKEKADEGKDANNEQAVGEALSGRATIDDKGTAITFSIKGKESLPADRRPHKVEVTTLVLESALSYETVPKIAPWVYLKAASRNTSQFPILAGDVNVFRSSGYVGTSHLEYIAPGEGFAVSLGVDEDLKIRRVIDSRVDSKPRLLGSTRTLTYGYELEVENYKPDVQTVTIVENIPVTQRKEIKVEVREGTTKPDEKDAEGFLRWKVELKPGEKKTVYFGYAVEYPSSFTLTGL